MTKPLMKKLPRGFWKRTGIIIRQWNISHIFYINKTKERDWRHEKKAVWTIVTECLHSAFRLPEWLQSGGTDWKFRNRNNSHRYVNIQYPFQFKVFMTFSAYNPLRKFISKNITHFKYKICVTYLIFHKFLSFLCQNAIQ